MTRRGHAHGGFASRGAATAARIPDAVLMVVGVIGMPRPELFGDVAGIILASAHRYCGSASAMGVPVGQPLRRRPERISTSSASCRCEVWRLLPVARRVQVGRRIPRPLTAMPGGQPSMTQPMAGPWLSPNVRDRQYSFPNRLSDTAVLQRKWTPIVLCVP